LECPKADVVGDPQALHDIGRRKPDDADHGMDVGSVRFGPEGPGDLGEPRGVHRVALAAGPEDIEVVVSGLQHHPNLAPEDVLDQALIVVPRGWTGGEHGRGVSGHWWTSSLGPARYGARVSYAVGRAGWRGS